MGGFSSGAQFNFITCCNSEQETKQSDQILCLVLLYTPQSHDAEYLYSLLSHLSYVLSIHSF